MNTLSDAVAAPAEFAFRARSTLARIGRCLCRIGRYMWRAWDASVERRERRLVAIHLRMRNNERLRSIGNIGI